MANTVVIRKQRIAPPKAPECVHVKVGYIKVQLSFLTYEPKHMRSQMLRNSCGARPPFAEDLCVLMPRMKVFNNIDAYRAPFAHLIDCGLLPSTTILLGYTVLEEDDTTLAFVV